MFGEQIRAGANERTAFIEPEAKDSAVVAEVLGRYRGMKKLKKPEEMNVYAPICWKVRIVIQSAIRQVERST